ncbi:hypothetical protein Micbo1qcDRAFT_179461 [Microdochium bolleyi]|uniref:Protein NO VEIN C-terminal domain-containing protein n=1 Tax=Microdochium bolleyi TaxID=196109 RepID=A0A136IPG1_9PEZI|nr:hypothetical protein Micbo1qcDRAFT_179461 [Microdochium bolleyi]
MEMRRSIGYRGEKVVFDFLSQHLHGVTYHNWTSRLRSHEASTGFPPFREGEGRHADFTYHDFTLSMRDLLTRVGAPLDPAWSRGTTYHVEVKTTTRSHAVPFGISDNQVKMMHSYRHGSSDAYILLLVYHVDDPGRRGIEIFSRPWELQRQRAVLFEPPVNCPSRAINALQRRAADALKDGGRTRSRHRRRQKTAMVYKRPGYVGCLVDLSARQQQQAAAVEEEEEEKESPDIIEIGLAEFLINTQLARVASGSSPAKRPHRSCWKLLSW